jgi:hypothetical protein
VTPTELEACRRDPAWESRQGISDRVVCRECAASVRTPMGGKKGHLWVRHRISVADYRAAYPSARLYSFRLIAQVQGCEVGELIRRTAERYVTPEELNECRHDPAWEKLCNLTDVIVCRQCGAKIRSALCGGTHHLSQHGWSLKEYLAHYPGAPWRTAAVADAQRRTAARLRADLEHKKRATVASVRWQKNNPEKVKKIQAKYRARPENKKKALALNRNHRARIRVLLQAAKRPVDWHKRPVAWRLIATELLLQDYLSNNELAQRLDSSNILRCPYESTWRASVESKGFAEFIRRIRSWIGRPGRIKGKTPARQTGVTP